MLLLLLLSGEWLKLPLDLEQVAAVAVAYSSFAGSRRCAVRHGLEPISSHMRQATSPDHFAEQVIAAVGVRDQHIVELLQHLFRADTSATVLVAEQTDLVRRQLVGCVDPYV